MFEFEENSVEQSIDQFLPKTKREGKKPRKFVRFDMQEDLKNQIRGVRDELDEVMCTHGAVIEEFK